MIEVQQPKNKKTLLVHAVLPGDDESKSQRALLELENLALTLNLEVLGQIAPNLRSIHPKTLIGSGKVEEIKGFCDDHDIAIVIFDNELTPAQHKNLELFLERKLMDRTGLILQIFSEHAKTGAAKKQVEVAQLKYFLPRLTKFWTHLERQQGGANTRGGMGEKQIEVDRRLIRRQIQRLESELKDLDIQRQTQRQKRKSSFNVALVGYTNVGKSTLLNALTSDDTYVADQLFATLDSRVRAMKFERKPKVLISDTVGFIDNLPHSLIASFKSTLSGIETADCLIQVVELNKTDLHTQFEATDRVLSEIGCLDKPRILVMNKVDQISEIGLLSEMMKTYPQAEFVSAKVGTGIGHLKERIFSVLEEKLEFASFVIPFDNGELFREIEKECNLCEVKYDETSWSVRFSALPSTIHHLRKQQSDGRSR